MRLTILIFTFFLLTNGFLIGQTNDSLVKVIDTKYKNVKENLENYEKVIVENNEESTEGGQENAYYEGQTLIFIELIWYGETGKKILEYYFDNGQLIFAFDQEFTYNRPIYWDEKKSKEMGDNEVFDSNKTIINQDRYYFNDELIFLWLDNEKNEIDLTMGTNTLIGKGLIAHAYKMKDKFSFPAVAPRK